MNAETCLKKLEYVGVLAFATVDSEGAPQIRNISAIHYEDNKMYFFTAKGKNFCRELMNDGRVQVLGYTKYKEMIRLSATAVPSPESEQQKWIDKIFEEYPYLYNLYPDDTRLLGGIVFQITKAEIEYFDLGVNPIFRGSYTIGNTEIRFKGFEITEKCIACGKCDKKCPQHCIKVGKCYNIEQEHCLHCGICYDICPTKAIERRD